MSVTGWRVGADIGGTFTDVVALSPDHELVRMKVLSTPGDYSHAIARSLEEGLPAGTRAGVGSVVHGTTVATNAILEETEQRIALVTTAGFRDVLELRRARRPSLYDLSWTPPPPLVPRWLRLEVVERTGADGRVVTPLDPESVRACVDRLRDEGVAAVAVCLLNSHANPAHEAAVAQALREGLPGTRVTTSAIAPEPKEYERTSTTVVNAFLLPVIEDYLHRLETSLTEIGVRAPLEIMQSDGTTAAAELARERPVLIIESGPAAGVIAAARLAREMGRRAVITFDMGGTTAKAGLVEDHTPRTAEELEVGAAHNRAGGLVRGAGFPVRSPCIDLSEVGAGGGSIAWLDGGGVLRVGPRSAGSEPGPACYGQGGTAPTVTDAHVALGYVSPTAIAGGTRKLHADLAREALETLAVPMGLSVEDVAHGIFVVATTNMRRAVRAVSVERGRDPRDFSLFAFGGAGGLHAAALADELEMDEVVVPMVPGLFSSLGLLFSDLAVSRVASVRDVVDAGTFDHLTEVADDLGAEALDDLQRTYPGQRRARVEAFANLRYSGQSSTLLVELPRETGDVEGMVAAFHDEHHRVFGQSAPGARVESVAVRVRATLPPADITFADIGRAAVAVAVDADPVGSSPRPVYLGPGRGWQSADVVARSALTGAGRAGPLVIEEPEATILVPGDFTASLDDTGSVVMRR